MRERPLVYGGGGWDAACSRGWNAGSQWVVRRVFARSAAVSVRAQNQGALFVHPMGKTSGKATKGGLWGSEGNATPSTGTSLACSQTR